MATQQELYSWLGLTTLDGTIDRSDLQTWVGLWGGVLSAAAAGAASGLVHLSVSDPRRPYLTVSAARVPYITVTTPRRPYITVTED